MKVSRLRVGFQFLLHVALISHVMAFYYLDWKDIGALDFQGFFHHLLGDGVLTAGALLTAVMFLAAFIFGRLFCSWGCHFAATQDLAAWALRKLGWKPPFVKTRILHLAPYAMLLGVFLLPPVQQWIDHRWGPVKVDFAGIAPGLAPWDTLPGWFLSVVTFLACGAGILLFLGTRGFCRFVCPYGAVFRIADKVTPFRVRRIASCSSSCDSSGVHPCTAACPTAIDVHGETQTWGKVINSDCVRCHLCIEACPSHSLAYSARPVSLGSAVASAGKAAPEGSPSLETTSTQAVLPGSTFRPLGVSVWAGKPPLAEPASRYTLPLWGECLILAVALVTYFACDLVYGAHFLAAAIALAEGFLAFLVARALAGDPKASFLGRPLRRGKSWTFLGISAGGALLLSAFPIFEGGAFKWLRWQALRLDPPDSPGADPRTGFAGSFREPRFFDAGARSRLAAAAGYYESALRYFPSNLETRRLLLSAYVRLRDQRAVAAAEEILRQSPPGDRAARENLLWVYERFGEGDKARALKGEGEKGKAEGQGGRPGQGRNQ